MRVNTLMRPVDLVVDAGERVDDLVAVHARVPAQVVLVCDASAPVGFLDRQTLGALARDDRALRELVGNVMEAPVTLCRGEDGVGEAAQAARRCNARLLVVVDALSGLRGWLYKSDLNVKIASPGE